MDNTNLADKIIVSTSPHLKSAGDTSKIMTLVSLSLLPTVVASVMIFGLRALIVIAVSVVTCLITEWLTNLVFKKENTLSDGSAVVTGILLAFTLPVTTPAWMVVIGGIIAIFLVKQLFGGLGFNIFNPALAARAVLLASWPVAMTTWIKPASNWISFDAVTTASPLGAVKEALRAGTSVADTYSYADLFFGTVPGSLGETCKLTLLIGGALLLLTRIIDWRIPVAYIGSVALLSWVFGRDPMHEVLAGGLILGAFFMATDMVTSPTTRTGKLVFGLGCGLVTALIRSYGGFPEGVCYSILIMNCVNPLIDKYIQPRVFGTTKALKKQIAGAPAK
jgi:electron transport complex protein RnfD